MDKIIDYNDIKDLELGANYSKLATEFRVFAPNREKIDLLLTDDYRKLRKEKIPMIKKDFGIFEVKVERNLDGYFYNYLVEDIYEVTDPYSKASSINSIMSAIVDMSLTNPKGFLTHKIPNNKEENAIIYELNVKDYTASTLSNTKNSGKFLGLAELDTTYKNFKTGLSHLKELGITHVQLLPVYDFISTFEENENFFDDDNYNWGYDPELYFNLEGSYSTNPYNPKTRIFEFKNMIYQLHEQGISVIMDVVYNHTFKSDDSNLETLAPYYYHRRNPDKTYSNGSGVGNELATERSFTRKLIIDSLKYWVKEYKIDGFRFDLMALIDIDTMKIAVEELKKINPNILIYGEPWMALGTSLPYEQQIWIPKQRSNGFGVFNDRFRDAIRGDSDGYQMGYIQGDYNYKSKIEEGVAGSVYYDQLRPGICDDAKETINYFNCHDNLIFYDKLNISLNNKENLNDIVKLGFAIILLSLGKPFIFEGNEFNNTKMNYKNSYNAPLSINAVDWSLKEKNYDLFIFVKDLISLRKESDIFTTTKAKEIRKKLKFIENLPNYILGYIFHDISDDFVVIINCSNKDYTILIEDIKKYYDLEKIKVKKIFAKNGKINNKINLENENKIERYSVNIYRIGENYGV